MTTFSAYCGGTMVKWCISSRKPSTDFPQLFLLRLNRDIYQHLLLLRCSPEKRDLNNVSQIKSQRSQYDLISPQWSELLHIHFIGWQLLTRWSLMRSFRRSIHFSALFTWVWSCCNASQSVCLSGSVLPRSRTAGAAARRSTPRCPASSGGLCGCIWPSVCPVCVGEAPPLWSETSLWTGCPAPTPCLPQPHADGEKTKRQQLLSLCLSVCLSHRFKHRLLQSPSCCCLLLSVCLYTAVCFWLMIVVFLSDSLL